MREKEERAEVVVVGAGFAGAATAWHLAERGTTDVLLLEADRAPGLHASGRNASLVFQLLKDADEAALVLEGARFYADPPAGFAAGPLFRRSGSLVVASPAGASDLEAAARDAGRLGLPIGIFDALESVRRVPLLEGSPIAVALEVPSDGIVDIRGLLDAYLSGATRRGARVHCGARVSAIETAAGAVSGVVVDGEIVRTSCVVNAAGAWAGEIGRLAGVGTRSIAPFRRHVFQTGPDARVDPGGPFVWHDDIDVYFRPEAGGVLASACDAEASPPMDARVDPGAEGDFQERLALAFPKLAPAPIASARACLRTFAADRRFLIGPDPDLRGLVWVAALGGHGMSASYGVGRLGAAAVLGETSQELRLWSPARL